MAAKLHILSIGQRVIDIEMDNCECSVVHCYIDALQDISKGRYNLITIYMSQDDSSDVFRHTKIIREISSVPIIVVAHIPYDTELIRCVLDSGADQFIVLPINKETFLSIVKSLHQRYSELRQKESKSATILSIKGITLSVEQRFAFVKHTEVILLPKEFDILVFLIQHPGYWYSADQIYEQVWKDNTCEYTKELVWSQISRLRKKLHITPDLPEFIENQRGVGYRFIQ